MSTVQPKRKTRAKKVSAKAKTQLEKLFVDSLKDIYWAEKKLTETLPKMEKAATTGALKKAISEHQSQTEEHVRRVEKIFSILGIKAQGKKCDAMEGLVEEGKSIVEETNDETLTRDVGIIFASQKIEHYEIATYGTLSTLAATMGYEEVADLLSQTLEEEKQADLYLTEIAEDGINWEAESEESKKSL